jgi:hypothetical protein
MRIYFKNLENVKKVSKKIEDSFDIKLSAAQGAIARACGYKDWFDLSKNYSAREMIYDQDLDLEDYINRQSQLVIRLAQELKCNCGELLYILSNSHLTGNRIITLEEQISIRRRCFQIADFNLIAKNQPGEVGGIVNSSSSVILRQYHQSGAVEVITHDSLMRVMVADFEYESPKKRRDIFIPKRLFLPYGYWVEEDGSKVLFSMDYKPLWRIKDNAKPERVFPWLRIEYIQQEYFFEGRLTNNEQKLKSILADENIFSTPILVECLPDIVFDQSINSINEAVDRLKDKYC